MSPDTARRPHPRGPLMQTLPASRPDLCRKHRLSCPHRSAENGPTQPWMQVRASRPSRCLQLMLTSSRESEVMDRAMFIPSSPLGFPWGTGEWSELSRDVSCYHTGLGNENVTVCTAAVCAVRAILSVLLAAPEALKCDFSMGNCIDFSFKCPWPCVTTGA